ncbi:MAG: hypothetical protein P1U77_23715 [Rubripirellula sp.]|nr:hypothetical protein [Rubripirellula sp.]
MGGVPGVGQKCDERMQELCPGLRIAGVESPTISPVDPAEAARVTSSYSACTP